MISNAIGMFSLILPLSFCKETLGVQIAEKNLTSSTEMVATTFSEEEKLRRRCVSTLIERGTVANGRAEKKTRRSEKKRTAETDQQRTRGAQVGQTMDRLI